MSRAEEIDTGAGAQDPAQDIPWGALAILFTAHFVVDGTINFIAPLLPLIREQFQVSLSTGGLLLTFASMSAALSQPVTAILVDRWPTLPWLAVGMVGSALFITSIGWAPNFTVLTVMVAVGGSMVGLCHPDMASRAGALSENRKGLVVSVFIAGGRVGHGLGPVIAIGIVSLGGMKWLWAFTLVAVAMALTVKYGLPKPESPPSSGDNKASIWDFVTALRTAGTPLLLLSGVTICRAVVNINFISLIPSLYAEHGMSIWSGGAASAIMLTSGAVGVLVGGFLGDRFGKKELIVGGIGIGALCVCAFLIAPPEWGFVLLAFLGVATYLPMGVTMAFAQQLMPHNRGLASSITLGLSWFIASLSVYPMSVLGEWFGLANAFWVLPGFFIAACAFALFLPKVR
ncbi:MAG: MFS transporter [Nitrospinae bacterium]|nr:MFS transporter [Nitrospinota bacterium]